MVGSSNPSLCPCVLGQDNLPALTCRNVSEWTMVSVRALLLSGRKEPTSSATWGEIWTKCEDYQRNMTDRNSFPSLTRSLEENKETVGGQCFTCVQLWLNYGRLHINQDLPAFLICVRQRHPFHTESVLMSQSSTATLHNVIPQHRITLTFPSRDDVSVFFSRWGVGAGREVQGGKEIFVLQRSWPIKP